MVDRENKPGQILYLPLKLVQPSSVDRGRLTVQLQELAASIEAVGILQPLTVRRSGREYVVVSGNRRLMAARMAGLGEVPCLLLTVDAGDAELIALTENLQREDLHYFDEARCLQDFLKHSGLTQAQAAAKLGRSQSAVANKLRLLGHSPRVREALREAGLSERHARELLRLEGEARRLQALEEIVRLGLSVAQTGRYIDRLLSNQGPLPEKLRRRDARLFLERVVRDARDLRESGLDAVVSQKPGEVVVTMRMGPAEELEKRPKCLL